MRSGARAVQLSPLRWPMPNKTTEQEIEVCGAHPSAALRAGFVENRDEWGSLALESRKRNKLYV